MTRGFKRFFGGRDPRDVITAASVGGIRGAASAASAAPAIRGDMCLVRAACVSGGVVGGGGGDSALLHVGGGEARVRLAAADHALVFEVDLGHGRAWQILPAVYRVIQNISNPRFLGQLTSYDVASNICQALGHGKIAAAHPSLEDVALMSSGGHNIVELPLKLPDGREKAGGDQGTVFVYWCSRARHIIHHIAYQCTPRHPPHCFRHASVIVFIELGSKQFWPYEMGFVRFTAHLEPIGGYDWGAPMTNLDHMNSGGAGGRAWPLISSSAQPDCLSIVYRFTSHHSPHPPSWPNHLFPFPLQHNLTICS